jgi:hypothetical protein
MLNALFMPQFNQISGKELLLEWSDPNIWRIYSLMMILLLGLAGAYPAWLLASFKPAKDMQERKKIKPLLRNGLVVFQFAMSVILIVIAIGMSSQLKYMRDKDLGFNKDNVLICNMYGMGQHFAAVKTELMRNTAVLDVTNANQNIMSVRSGSSISWEGRTTDDSNISVRQIRVDTSFVNVMQISLSEGQNFTSMELRQAIPNETAIKAMGLSDPIGKWAEMWEWGDERGVIVGVAKDYHFTGLQKMIEPIVLYYEPPIYQYSRLYVRVAAGMEQQAIAAVETLWKQYNPAHTFDYHFLDDEFDTTYKSEIRTGLLFGIFSCIAILISCLGLFGLITYIAETKTKEIGIRKVFGASIRDVVNMLSKEFLILVGIASLIGLPLAYYWLNSILQDFHYRIGIGWWMFALAGTVTILLTLITVGWQAIKAATANPVEAINS